jgi:hypothetical protein
MLARDWTANRRQRGPAGAGHRTPEGWEVTPLDRRGDIRRGRAVSWSRVFSPVVIAVVAMLHDRIILALAVFGGVEIALLILAGLIVLAAAL